MKTQQSPPQCLLPPDLDLRTVSRWPTTLSAATEAAVDKLAWPWHKLPACDSAHKLEAHATPTASIIILTRNNLRYTRLCIESLLPHTADVDYELIVVDNNSTDGTREYLRDLADATDLRPPTTDHRLPAIRLLFNDQNFGFAKGCNQGLALARSENLVLLNNDTILPPGWLSRLLAWLEDDCLGLVGPVTNRSGNESQIQTSYNTLAEFLEFSTGYTAAHSGESFDIRVATMFCAAMRRGVYRQVGPLDEQFELALFEDDDYSMRVRQSGLAVRCVEDVCIHHFGQASVGKLDGRYGELFHANRRRWEDKWKVAWKPYTMRHDPGYEALTARIADMSARLIPAGCSTLVLSKGDDALLVAIGPHARHFPQDRAGGYAGYNPADSLAAIAQIEDLRAAGASYLLIPATSLWWLDHYNEFSAHLRRHFQVIHEQADECLIFSIGLNTIEAEEKQCFRRS